METKLTFSSDCHFGREEMKRLVYCEDISQALYEIRDHLFRMTDENDWDEDKRTPRELAESIFSFIMEATSDLPPLG